MGENISVPTITGYWSSQLRGRLHGEETKTHKQWIYTKSPFWGYMYKQIMIAL